MSRQNCLAKLFMMSIVCFTCIVPAIAEQWIAGSVSIRNEKDQNVYGERLAIFLVNEETTATATKCSGETHPQRKLDCINNSHLDFYKQFQQHLQKPGYLIDQAETSATGNFVFFNIPPGSYFVLVKFPSMIDGYKVAWQVPVSVSPDRTRFVTLNDENLLLPKNRRR
jgi:hypothetical protein